MCVQSIEQNTEKYQEFLEALAFIYLSDFNCKRITWVFSCLND